MPFLVWFFITIQQTGTKVSSASSSSLLLLDLVIDDLCQLFGWCRIEKRPHVWMVVQYVNFHASKYIFFSIFDLWLIFRRDWWTPVQFLVCTFSCIFGPDSLPDIESSEWLGRILGDGNVHTLKMVYYRNNLYFITQPWYVRFYLKVSESKLCLTTLLSVRNNFENCDPSQEMEIEIEFSSYHIGNVW